MRSLIILLIVSMFFGCFQNSLAIEADSTKVYELDSILVIDQREAIGLSQVPVSKDKYGKILLGNGINLIRKGTFIAQDLYSEGFKRGEVEVVIDGEKYHSACPNRMDSPVTRINPLEMNTIVFTKDNSCNCTNLGGGVAINRVMPSGLKQMKIAYSQGIASEENKDVAFSSQYNRTIYSGRYSTGRGFENGDDKSFEDLYGYRENYGYKLGEVSILHTYDDLKIRGAFTYSDNIMFPYLQMDERINRIYNASVSYKSTKLYANYTNHLMDNRLRVSNMYMSTGVENVTVGLLHKDIELLFRNWDSDNIIRTPMGMTINNHLIPDISYYSALYQHTHSFKQFDLSYKGGLQYITLGDADKLPMYTSLYPDASEDIHYYSAALFLSKQITLKQNMYLKFNTGISSSEPSLEQLYIAVNRPMGKPTWMGNPTLSQPMKFTFRPTLLTKHLNLSLYAHYVSDYITLTNASAGSNNYKTYRNIDAFLTGFLCNLKYKNLTVSSGYTYAENRTDDSPLSEIAPFYLITTINSPQYKKVTVSITHNYNDAQTRVDSASDEYPTTSWHSFDMSVNYIMNDYQFAVEIDNLFDKTYAQHLSYLRDPFSSGLPVTDPGLTVRVNLLTNFDI